MRIQSATPHPPTPARPWFLMTVLTTTRNKWVDSPTLANYSSPLRSKVTTQFPLNIIWQFGSDHKTQWGWDSYCTGFNYLTIAFNRCSVFVYPHIQRNLTSPLKSRPKTLILIPSPGHGSGLQTGGTSRCCEPWKVCRHGPLISFSRLLIMAKLLLGRGCGGTSITSPTWYKQRKVSGNDLSPQPNVSHYQAAGGGVLLAGHKCFITRSPRRWASRCRWL